MKKENAPLIHPFYQVAWAVPIRPRDPTGMVNPMVFQSDLPDPPDANAVYTYLNEDGKIVPKPHDWEKYLPAFCYVQYVEECPPPPPPGYRYAMSELQKDVCSPAYHYYHEIGNPRYGIDTPNIAGFAPVELTLQERSGMISALMELPDGYYSTEAGVLVSNFVIEIHSILRVFGMNDMLCEKVEYSVRAQGSYLLSHEECDLESLDRLPEQIRSKVAGCMININVPRVDAQIVFHIRSSLLMQPRIDKYRSSGWKKINGVWLYAQDSAKLAGSGIVFETDFKIARNPSLSAKAALSSAMGMLAVSDRPEVIIPIVLYAHLGVIFSLFEQAGFSPRMLLFINGTTGSLKTAVCAVVFNLTGEVKRNIPATFRDSVASVEAKFPDYVDKVLLLDDYSPATTAKNRADMNKLLEDTIRYYGDGKGRGRSNATVTKAVTPVPRGLCCITGEDTGGSQSSLLRCVLIDVSNGVFNGEVLAPYQSDPRLWTTHFAYFVEYIASHFDSLVEDIRHWFPVLRSELRCRLNAGRAVDSAIYLCLTAKIVLLYARSVGWITEQETVEKFNFWCSAVVEAVKRSEDTSTEMDPVRFYLITLFEAVSSGAESIAPNKEAFVDDPSVLGYDNDGQWHIWPDRAYALAVKRCQLQRKNFPLGQVKTHAALADANLIEVTEDRRKEKMQVNYIRRESFGERPIMLVINKEAAQRYLEN